MKKEREDRPYFDENKNYLDEDPKPLFDKQKIIEEKVVIKRIRKQFALSKSIITSQHGDILVESREGEGTRFQVRIYKTIL